MGWDIILGQWTRANISFNLINPCANKNFFFINKVKYQKFQTQSHLLLISIFCVHAADYDITFKNLYENPMLIRCLSLLSTSQVCGWTQCWLIGNNLHTELIKIHDFTVYLITAFCFDGMMT